MKIFDNSILYVELFSKFVSWFSNRNVQEMCKITALPAFSLETTNIKISCQIKASFFYPVQ